MSTLIILTSTIDTGEIAGLVEISMEEPNGKLAPPLQSFKGFPPKSAQPYLCNLAVRKSCRQQGLGSILCELCEHIVLTYWKRSKLYLHVMNDNIAAQSLYRRLGYNLARFGIPSWERKILGLDDLIYYSKDITIGTTPGSDSSAEVGYPNFLI